MIVGMVKNNHSLFLSIQDLLNFVIVGAEGGIKNESYKKKSMFCSNFRYVNFIFAFFSSK